MLDAEHCVEKHIITYLSKFSAETFTKNLIVIMNRADGDIAESQANFCNTFNTYVDKEYNNHEMRRTLKRDVEKIPILSIDEGEFSEDSTSAIKPDEKYYKLIELIKKKGASKEGLPMPIWKAKVKSVYTFCFTSLNNE